MFLSTTSIHTYENLFSHKLAKWAIRKKKVTPHIIVHASTSGEEMDIRENIVS